MEERFYVGTAGTVDIRMQRGQGGRKQAAPIKIKDMASGGTGDEKTNSELRNLRKPALSHFSFPLRRPAGPFVNAVSAIVLRFAYLRGTFPESGLNVENTRTPMGEAEATLIYSSL